MNPVNNYSVVWLPYEGTSEGILHSASNNSAHSKHASCLKLLLY